MTLRLELEQSIRDWWRADDLGVYGDLLQEQAQTPDDALRGQLCALDLKPGGDSWQDARAAILQEWLGELGPRVSHLVQHGFVPELVHDELAAEVLRSPLGEFVCSFTASPIGPGAGLRALQQLADSRRPWLRRIAIEWSDSAHYEQDACNALIAATPNLLELYSLGRQCFRSFHHPSLQRLHISPDVLAPHSNVVATEVGGCGYLDNLLVQEDFQLGLILEAIKVQHNCAILRGEYAEMLEPHDTVTALLLRLRRAGLVRMHGTDVRLTQLGSCFVHWPDDLADPAEPPRRLPSTQVDGKYYLWAQGTDENGERRSFHVHLGQHLRFLISCLREFGAALDDETYEAICDHIDNAHQLFHAEDRVTLTTTAPLLTALRFLLPVGRLQWHYEQDKFAPRDQTEWLHLEQLVTFLEACSAPIEAWVAWGN